MSFKKEPQIQPDRSIKPSLLPAAHHFKNRQLSLFQNFLCNTDGERKKLSNLIELWDSVPRYSISQLEMSNMRDERGFLDVRKLEFEYRKNKYNVIIQPALVQIKKDGEIKTTAYYPSANEELVEEALRKLAVEQGRGFYNDEKPKAISGVVFSLNQLRKELTQCNHARTIAQLKLSLDILSRSHIQIIQTTGTSESEIIAASTYLPVVFSVTRKDMKNDPDAKWMVQFPPLLTDSIDKFSFRQFNYHQLMSHRTPLARWLHKLLNVKYTFASRLKPFEIRYSTIQRDSAMLNNYKRGRAAQDACDLALDELVENGVMAKIERCKKEGARGKILDIVYTLTPSDQFVKEVKAANLRCEKTL